MHVILTTNYSPWSAYSGGGQRSTHNLATALARRGHAVEVVYTKPPWEAVDAPASLSYRIHWAALPAVRSSRSAPLRPLTALSVAWTVRRLLRSRTVVHSNGEESALLPALRRYRAFPFLLTPRYPAYPTALLQRAAASQVARLRLHLTEAKFALLGVAARQADLCCPTSQSAARALQQAYALSPSRLCVVPNGVSNVFLSANYSSAPKERIVFFGRLARAKGADVLLEALAQLGAHAPAALIIGRGEERAALAKQIRALRLDETVQLRGWMDSEALSEVLAQSAMAVLPSREESFGNAMAEAMAVGTPTISTTAGSVPEVVTDGETGLLVPPGDASALAEAITYLQNNPAEARQLGESGRERVKEHFTWSAVAQQFEQLYRELLGP